MDANQTAAVPNTAQTDPNVDPKAEAAKPTGASGAPTDKVTSNSVSEAAKEAIRRHKVKVAGEEIEVDEEELKRGYSHGKAAAKAMSEATRLRKQAETFVNMMKDPTKLREALVKLGHDPRKLSEEYLAEALSEELMDPKDKELKITKTKLQQMEEMDRLQKEAVARKRDEALKAKYSKDYSEQFVEALKTTQLPPTKHAVAEMAKYVYRAAEIGMQLTPKEAALLVKQDMEKIVRTAISESDGETLVKLLGEEAANKLRQWDTSRVKDPNAALKNPEPPGPRKERRDPTKRMTTQQWREFNRK